MYMLDISPDPNPDGNIWLTPITEDELFELYTQDNSEYDSFNEWLEAKIKEGVVHNA